ncbi:hypothetical protein BDV06DRAFT_5236 [Aspergillus oleicola]
MDNIPEYMQNVLAHPALQQIASSPLAHNINHIHSTFLAPSIAHLRESYVDPSLAHFRMTYLDPYVVQPLAHLLASMPDLASVLVLIFVLFISFKVLDYTRRAVMFWVWLTFRLVWWASVISLGIYMYQAGWEKVARDLGFVFNFLVGLLETVGRQLEEYSAKAEGGGAGGYGRKDL